MGQLSLYAALAAWGLLPGLALLRALASARSFGPVEALALAPGLSLALVSACGYGATAVGWRLTPLPVAALLAAVIAVVFVLRRRVPRFGRGQNAPPSAGGSEPKRAEWLVLLAPVAVFLLLTPMREIPVLPPTLHDGLDHARYFRGILDQQTLDRFRVMAPPFYKDGSPLFYPWGFHGWAALVAESAAVAPMRAFWASLLFISCAIPLTVFAFVREFIGRLPAVFAGFATIFVWELPFEAWRWGGYALLAGAVALLPLVRLTLLGLRSPAALFASAVAAAGLALIHPSQAMAALLITGVIAIAASSAGQLPRRVRWIAAGIIAVVGLALALGPRFWQPLAEFTARAAREGDRFAGQPAWSWPFGVYGKFLRDPDGRVWVFALAIAGAVASLRHPRQRVLLLLHGLISVLVLLTPAQTWLTTLFYHEPERIWYLNYACLPGLAALGLSACVRFVQRALSDVDKKLPSRGWLLLGLALVFLGPVGFRHYAYSVTRLSKYARGPLSFTDHRVLADFDWIERNVPEGEVIFNSPADWGLARPFTGHRYVYFSGGIAHEPKTKWPLILRALNRPREHFPAGLGWLSNAGIRHLLSATYADDRAPLDRDALRMNPALEEVYSSDTGAVFRLRRFWVRYVDLEQPEVAGVELSGFHEVEANARPDGLIVSPIFRWTNGDARVKFSNVTERGSSCLFSVAGPEGQRFQVFQDGQELERAPVGFVVPPERVPARSLTFEIRSEKKKEGKRQLGIRVMGAGLFCTTD